jgi:hypothetical protein
VGFILVPVISLGFVSVGHAGGEAHDYKLTADFSAADGDAFPNAKGKRGDDGRDEDEGK